jgi:hypothetical protein
MSIRRTFEYWCMPVGIAFLVGSKLWCQQIWVVLFSIGGFGWYKLAVHCPLANTKITTHSVGPIPLSSLFWTDKFLLAAIISLWKGVEFLLFKGFNWQSQFGWHLLQVWHRGYGCPCRLDQKPGCSVLDIGSGSGRLLQQLAKQGYAVETGHSD